MGDRGREVCGEGAEGFVALAHGLEGCSLVSEGEAVDGVCRDDF